MGLLGIEPHAPFRTMPRIIPGTMATRSISGGHDLFLVVENVLCTSPKIKDQQETFLITQPNGVGSVIPILQKRKPRSS